VRAGFAGLNRAGLLAVLEIRRMMVNWGELAFGLALPVVLFALMYGAFGQDVVFRGTAQVVDRDGGAEARAFVEQLDALPEISVRERSLSDAERALDRSAILLAIVIPPGFSEGLERGETVSLRFLQHGNGGDEGQVVAALARAVALGLAREAGLRTQLAAALGEGEVSLTQDLRRQIDATVAELRTAGPAVGVQVRMIDEGNPDFIHRMVAGLLVMFVMFSVTLSSQYLVEERQLGTLERLLTTRMNARELFLGKFLAGIARGAVQAVLLLVLAFGTFRLGGVAEFGGMLLLTALLLAAVSAIGLVIGALAQTPDQASWAAAFLTTYMAIFGGNFIAISGEGVLGWISQFTLNRHVIDAMIAVFSQGESAWQQVGAIALMLVTALLGLLLARWAFRFSDAGAVA